MKISPQLQSASLEFSGEEILAVMFAFRYVFNWLEAWFKVLRTMHHVLRTTNIEVALYARRL